MTQRKLTRSKAARERLALRVAPWLARRYWHGVYDGTIQGIRSENPDADRGAAWVEYTANTVANQLDLARRESGARRL